MRVIENPNHSTFAYSQCLTSASGTKQTAAGLIVCAERKAEVGTFAPTRVVTETVAIHFADSGL